MHVKQFAVLFLVQIFLVSCQSKEAQMQETMIEVERLDLLRKKANETVTDRKTSLLLKKREYQAWGKERVSLYKESLVQIQKHEKFLKNYNEYYSKELSSGQNREIQPMIQKAKNNLASAKRVRDEIQRQANEKEPVFLKQIEALESSLSQAQAEYDRINALHTKEVAKLATYTSK